MIRPSQQIRKQWRRFWNLPAVRSLSTDLRLLRAYGTRSPEKIRLANSSNVIFLDATEERARTIIRGLGRGLQPRLRGIWHDAIQRLQPTIVLDVGVNYGEFLFAESYDPHARVIGIEANRQLERWISRSVAAHPNQSQIEILYALASDRDNEQQTFYVARDWSGASSAVLHAGHDLAETSVPTIAIDSLFEGRDLSADIIVFKIDTEGYEPVVMSGMRETMKRCPNLLGIVEFDTQQMTPLNVDLDQFLRELAERFAIHLLDPAGRVVQLDEPSIRRVRKLFGVEDVVCDLLLASRIELFEQLRIS